MIWIFIMKGGKERNEGDRNTNASKTLKRDDYLKNALRDKEVALFPIPVLLLKVFEKAAAFFIAKIINTMS